MSPLGTVHIQWRVNAGVHRPATLAQLRTTLNGHPTSRALSMGSPEAFITNFTAAQLIPLPGPVPAHPQWISFLGEMTNKLLAQIFPLGVLSPENPAELSKYM